MALVAMATAPLAYPPWHAHGPIPWFTLAAGYAALALIAWQWSRKSVSGGVVPPGALGDSRFVLALVATAGLVLPPVFIDAPVPVLMLTGASFVLLLIAVALCGASDGAWNGAATRHLRLSPFQVISTFVRAAWSRGACSWRIVTASATGTAPPPPAPPSAAPPAPLEQIHLDPSLVAAHGARSLVLTLAVLAMGIVSFALAPPIDHSWALIAGGYPAFAVVSFLAVRFRPGTAIIPIGAHGDSRVLCALFAMALFLVIPDGKFGDILNAMESAPINRQSPPDWMIPAAAEALTLGLAPPIAFSLLLAASAVCGAADGAWIAMTMRHLKLSFRQAILTLLRGVGATGARPAGDPGRDAP